MGGMSPVPGTRGVRRAVDAVINLVPFIDLLSCCISFLLITAVWSQVAVLEGRPSGAVGEGGAPRDERVRFALHVSRGGYVFTRSDGSSRTIPRRDGQLDAAALAEVLRGAHAQLPDLDELAIHAEDSIAYEEIVRTMDTALAARFVGLTIEGDGAL